MTERYVDMSDPRSRALNAIDDAGCFYDDYGYYPLGTLEEDEAFRDWAGGIARAGLDAAHFGNEMDGLARIEAVEAALKAAWEEEREKAVPRPPPTDREIDVAVAGMVMEGHEQKRRREKKHEA